MIYSITCFIIIELTNGPPPIRLIDGETSHEGRVEIYIQVHIMSVYIHIHIHVYVHVHIHLCIYTVKPLY